MSWLLPAIIFGIMIYGWQAMTGQSTRYSQLFKILTVIPKVSVCLALNALLRS